jgi:glyoxylase-like metal-dependent hydrolase (beta-lactamase superfamily II)
MTEGPMSRAFRILLAAILTLQVVALAAGINGQIYDYREKKDPPPFKFVTLAKGLYLAKGEWGANVGVFVGEAGILVVDAKATVRGTRKVVDAIAEISSQPITRIVFTHSDSDCVNGYAAYPAKADVIIGLKTLSDITNGLETYLEMDAPIGIYDPRPTFKLKPALAFSGELRLRFGSETIELIQQSRAHTAEDTSVCFPDKAIAFIGDLAFSGRDPLVQDRKGGMTFGLIMALSTLLERQPPIQLFVPSHADPMSRDEIKALVDYMKETYAKVAALVDAGESEAEVKQAFGIEDPPKKDGLWTWPPFAMKVYLELSKKRSPKDKRTTKGQANDPSSAVY